MYAIKNKRFWLLVERKMLKKASLKELTELDEMANNDPLIRYTVELVYELWTIRTVEKMEEAVQKRQRG